MPEVTNHFDSSTEAGQINKWKKEFTVTEWKSLVGKCKDNILFLMLLPTNIKKLFGLEHTTQQIHENLMKNVG